MMPWAQGHQIKAITRFVLAIIEKQTGCQAKLADLLNLMRGSYAG